MTDRWRPSGHERRDEVRAKLARVRRYLGQAGLDAVLLSRRGNFAWLTAGGDNHVVSAAADGPAHLLVTRDTAQVISTSIEMPRLVAEEIDDLDLEPVTVPWHENGPQAVAAAVSGMRVAADTAVLAGPLLGLEFARVRFALLPSETERYRRLGRTVAGTLEAVVRNVDPGDTEWEISGRLAAALAALGVTPVVVLVAADDRIARYRHPIPTPVRVARRAMVALVAEAGGLHVALSRLVHHGSLPRELARRHAAVVAVDGVLAGVSRPGARAGDALRAAIDAYREQGFEGEWQWHHQGGPTGYAPRDYLATPGTDEVLVSHQAVAWNPSIAGTKSEDTLLVEPEGPVYVTLTGAWPTLKVVAGGQTFERPAILER
jgi:Xaa-Pro aminopeptidase